MALESMRTRIDALEWERQRLETENRQLKTQNPDRAAEVERLRQYQLKLEDCVIEIETLTERLKTIPDLEAQLSEYMQKAETLEKEVADLQERQSDVVARATERLRLDSESLEERARQAEEALDSANEMVRVLQEQVASLTLHNERLQSQYKELELLGKEKEASIRQTLEVQHLRMMDETHKKWEAREERLLQQLGAPTTSHKSDLSTARARVDHSTSDNQSGHRSVMVSPPHGSMESLLNHEAYPPPTEWMARAMLAQQLPPIPKFTGEDTRETFRDWKEQFEMVAELGGWDDHTKLVNLTTRLKGQAYSFYRSCNIQKRANYELLTTELAKRFTPVQITAVQSSLFHERRQKLKESVDDYAQDLRRLFYEAYPTVQQGSPEASEMGKSVLANQFVNGLNHELKQKLAGREGDFDQLLVKARFEEVRLRELGSYKHGSTDRGREKPNSKGKAEMTQRPLPDPQRSIQCYHCKRMGHTKRQCPQLARNQEEARGPPNTKSTKLNAAITEAKRDTERKDATSKGAYLDEALESVARTMYGISTGKLQNAVLGPCIRVSVMIEGKPVNALVDTGSPATIVSLQFLMQVMATHKRPEQSAEEWKSEVRGRIQESGIVLRSYAGPELNLVGQIHLSLSRGTHQLDTIVQVQHEAPVELLLGTDVLPKLGFALIVKDDATMTDMFKVEGSTLEECAVHLLQAVRIPARHQRVVKARVTQLPTGRDTLFEPVQELQQFQMVSTADSLVTPDADGCISVLMSNATHVATQLEEGLVIGHVVPVQDLVKDDHSDAQLRPGGDVALISDTDADVRVGKLLEQTKLDDEGTSNHPTLSEQQIAKLKNLLIRNQHLFAFDGSELGSTDLVTHSINTGDHPPVRQQIRRMPFALRETVDGLVSEMLEQGVIEPSKSPWASPIVLVKKKDDSIRFCVDYRRLNSITKVDVFPLPRIDDALDILSGAKYFTSLDLASGYWQVRMAPESQEKTAFITYSGLYEFTKMPFGLCNAPATFQRLMETVLAGLNRKMCIVYLDDILVFSQSYDEHLQHLQEVFDRLDKAGLRMKPKKCDFCCEKVTYLGHIVSREGICVDPTKVEAIKCFPQPRDLKRLRSFLGLASYYRRFIQNFSKVASPLYALTKKNAEFSWTDECQKTFEVLKEMLTSTPVLAFPDFDKDFILETDASGDGLGAVLSQKVEGVVRPIAYASRTLQTHEKNLGITELEALGVVWAIKHFRPYLYGHHCDLFTDHIALKSLLNTPQPSGKLARWGLALQDLDINIQYRPGKANTNADVLSRQPVEMAPRAESGLPTAMVAAQEVAPTNIVQSQRQDSHLQKIIDYLEKGELPRGTKEARELVLSQPLFELQDQVLYRVEKDKTLRLVLPESLRKPAFDEAHRGVYGGHLRDAKIHSVLSRHYWWPSMRSDIIKWCKACVTCASRRIGTAIQPPLTPIPVSGPFDRVGVDVIQFPKSMRGNQYAVVFVDYLTKWPEVFPVPDQTSLTIAKLLVEEIVSRHGVPREVLSDRGKNFLSDLMREVYDLLGTHKVSTTAYHPQTDGLVERFNRTLTDMLAKTVERQGRDWDDHLPYVLFAYRMCAQQSTKESPFFLLYGRDPQLPTEQALTTPKTRYQIDLDDYKVDLMGGLTNAWELAREQVKKSQKSQKKHHDKKVRGPKVRVGDRAFLYMPAATKGPSHKFSRPFHGPYRVLEVTSNDARVQPVHSPNQEPIFVSLNRVRYCPAEVSDDEFWPPKKQRNRKSPPDVTEDQEDHLDSWQGRLRPRP